MKGGELKEGKEVLAAATKMGARRGFVLGGEREKMEYDVVVVGAGPAGLATAIRLKQLSSEVSVCVLEKGAEVGSHVLSGAVVDPCGLDELIPEWREDAEAPLKQKVTKDRFVLLGPSGDMRVWGGLLPPMMKNHGCYIGSLGDVCRWLAEKAEGMGVEIYPGFAASEVLEEGGVVKGVATGDMGLSVDGKKKSGYQSGMELRGTYTIFAEGARGSCTKYLYERYAIGLGREPQKYGLGIKELWELSPEKHEGGLVQHTMGWPLGGRTGGGSFVYHYGENLASVGFVTHLNYKNPHISPFDEFQKFKTHESVRPMFEGGRRVGYGARVITEGGWQSVPRVWFPGGALAGCAAGFVNVPRIKGSHNAIRTGILAAEAAYEGLQGGGEAEGMRGYEDAWRKSATGRELKEARNVKPLWSRYGTWLGAGLGAVDMWMRYFRMGLPFTMKHGGADHEGMKEAAGSKKPAYPRADGEVTFDKTSSVYLASTAHEEDQPTHLRLEDEGVPIGENLPRYDEPAQRYCPAGVYEVVEEGGESVFRVNAANCVHCKTCDVKDPSANINWVAPEGGSGPSYRGM